MQKRFVAVLITLVVSAASVVAGAPVSGAAEREPQVPAADSAGKAPESMASQEDAVVAARRWNKPVVVDSLTAPQREVRALANGQLEATVHTAPVRALRDGKWTPINTTLRREQDGDLVPGATTVGLVFSGGGDKPFVRMTRAGKELSLTWPYGRLPAPVVDGETATYANVLKDVDLVLHAAPDGFSHVLRVKTPEAAALPQIAELKLKLGADRMKFTGDGEGGLKVLDQAAGGEVFRAPQPVMWDSSGQDSGQAPAPANGTASRSSAQSQPATRSASGRPAGGKAGSGGSGSVRTDLSEGPADGSVRASLKVTAGGGRLTLVPDQKLLRGAKTTYPVFIDPDWQAPNQSKAVMVSTKYTSASWTDEGMGLCNDGDPYQWDCGGVVTKRLFFRFALPDAVRNTSVLKAEFKVNNTHSYNCTARAVEVWKTKGVSNVSPWSTQAASGFWQRQVISASFAHGNESVGCSNSLVTMTSASLRQEVDKAAKNGGVIWLGMKAGSESSTAYWKRFSDKAALRVLYNLPPKVPTNLGTQSEAANPFACAPKGDTMPYVRTWPTMRAKVTDPQSSDRVQAEFLIGWADAAGANFGWNIGGGFPAGSTYGPDGIPVYSNGGNSGSVFTKSLAGLASRIPKNRPVAWTVRGHDFEDGHEGNDWRYWQSSSLWTNTSTAKGGVGHGCWFVYDDTAPPPPTVTSAKYPADNVLHEGVGQTGSFTITAAAGSEPLQEFRYQFTPAEGSPEGIVPLTLGSGSCNATSCTFPWAPSVQGNWRLDVWAVDKAGRRGSANPYHFRVRKLPGEEAHWRLNDPARSATLRDAVVTSDTYQLVSQVNGKCLNAEGGSVVNGTQIVQFACGGVDWERWKITDKTDTEFTLTSRQSDKCLSVADASTANGAKTVLGDCTDLPQNRWKRVLVAGEKNIYQVVSVVSDKCLTVQGAGTADSVPAVQQDCADVPEQKWDFTSVNQGHVVGTDIALDVPARVDSRALRLNTDSDPATFGYAATKLPVVDPTKSYSLSMWARPMYASTWGTVAAQEGNRMSAFLVEQTPGGTWAMSTWANDADSSPVVRAQSTQPVKTGQWTHLVGVYDAAKETTKLYVDGQLQGIATQNLGAWSSASRGPFVIGTGKLQGNRSGHFAGEIDDVRVFDRVVTDQEVAAWYKPTVQARWRLNEPVNMNVTTADDTGAGHELQLKGGAEITTDEETCVNLTRGCMKLEGVRADGTGEWAQTNSPVVRTDGSFTVAGWVDAASPTVPMTVFSAAGTTQSAFTVRFNPKAALNPDYDPDRDDPSAQYIKGWQIEMPNSDTSSPTRATAYHGTSCNVCTDEGPDHLALVYDAVADTMKLFVNGVLSETETNLSWRDGVVGFHGGGPLQIGRGFANGQIADNAASREYFSGLIDDVWVIKGALGEDELALIKALDEPDNSNGNPALPETYGSATE